MSEQTCETCGRPGRTVPLTAEGRVIGESTLHEDDEGIVTHNVMYHRDGVPPEMPEGSGFSFRVPDDEPGEPVPWSRAVLPTIMHDFLATPEPPAKDPDPGRPRVLRDVTLQWLSLDLEPGSYQAIPEAAEDDEESQP